MRGDRLTLLRRSRIWYGASGLSFDSVSGGGADERDIELNDGHGVGSCGHLRDSKAYVVCRREDLSPRHVRGGCLRRGYAHDRLSIPFFSHARISGLCFSPCPVFRGSASVVGVVVLSRLYAFYEARLRYILMGSCVASRNV